MKMTIRSKTLQFRADGLGENRNRIISNKRVTVTNKNQLVGGLQTKHSFIIQPQMRSDLN